MKFTAAELAEIEALLNPIAQVRLTLHPDRLEPTDGQLLVVLKTDVLPEECRERWDSWWDSLHVRAEKVGLNLLANRYATLDQLSARDYMTSIELDVDLW